MRKVIVVALCFFVSCVCAIGEQIDLSFQPDSIDKSRKVSHALYEVRELHESKLLAAENLWETYRARVIRDSLQVRVLLKQEATDSLLDVLWQSGGSIQRYRGRSVQMLVPFRSLDWFEKQSDIAGVYLPHYAVPLDIISEGLDTLGIPSYHTRGYLGQGVKIAVLDGGFQDYSQYLGTELPSTVGTKEIGNTLQNGETHGTFCAQIIYDIAPEAELWLIAISTDLDFLAACDWISENGFDIVSASIGFYNVGWPDGSSSLSECVSGLRNQGILWVSAAGNHREEHWYGSFSNPDDDKWLDFYLFDETNNIYLYAGDIIDVRLTWDDWTYSDQDYDLVLLNKYLLPFLWSDRSQNGYTYPTERLVGVVPSSGYYP